MELLRRRQVRPPNQLEAALVRFFLTRYNTSGEPVLALARELGGDVRVAARWVAAWQQLQQDRARLDRCVAAESGAASLRLWILEVYYRNHAQTEGPGVSPEASADDNGLVRR